MSRPKDDLIQQLDRIPLNRFLRQEATAGVEALSDAEAQERSAELAVALDRLPALLERLRAEHSPEAGQQEGSSASTVGSVRQPERAHGVAGAMDDLGSLREYRERFSEPAKSAARKALSVYTAHLIQTALAYREINRGDVVSERDVQEASRFLNRRAKDGRKELWGILGGILLGAGASVSVTMLSYSPPKVLVGVMLVVLGAFCVAWVLGSRRPVVRPETPDSARARDEAPSTILYGPAVQSTDASRSREKRAG